MSPLVQDLGNLKNRYFQNVKSRNRGMKIDLPWSQQLKRRQRFIRMKKLSYLPEIERYKNNLRTLKIDNLKVGYFFMFRADTFFHL